jgi:hypothetical protein
MDNLLIALIYIGGLSLFLGIGAYVCDVIESRLVDTNKGPRSMATRLSPEEHARRLKNREQSSPQHSNIHKTEEH